MKNTIFFIGDEPYLLWEADLKESNIRFLKTFDAEYFDYLVDLHLKAGDEKRAAMSLRLAYHHALETLFSLLGAVLQAPNCPNAWITRNKRHLNDVIRRISEKDQTLPTLLNNKNISWRSLAESIFYHFKPGTEKQAETIDKFSELWRLLADEFLDKNRIDEYNCLKHGFRVSSGGCVVSAGIQSERSIPCPPEKMTTLGGSDFGTGFDRIEKTTPDKNNRSLASIQVILNWKIEKVISLIRLISISIQNTVGALKIITGESASEIKFLFPSDPEDFDKPWDYIPSVPHVSMKVGYQDGIPVVTKEDLVASLNNRKNK